MLKFQKYKNRILFLSSFLLMTGQLLALDAKEVIAKMQETYAKAGKLEYSCTYELFKGHQGTELSDTYSGYVYRDEAGQYQKIGANEYIYGKDFFLEISHEEKEFHLEKARKIKSSEADLDLILKACSSATVKENGDVYIVELLFNAAEPAFSSVVLEITKSDYKLKQLDMYYSGTYDFSQEQGKQDLQQPHLRMTFSKISLKPKNHSDLLDLSAYTNDTNGTLVPKELYTGYALNDNRHK